MIYEPNCFCKQEKRQPFLSFNGGSLEDWLEMIAAEFRAASSHSKCAGTCSHSQGQAGCVFSTKLGISTNTLTCK